MKCVDCGKKFEAKAEQKRLRATLDNPGIVVAVGDVIACPNCDQHYADREEALNVMEGFEKDRLLKEKR